MIKKYKKTLILSSLTLLIPVIVGSHLLDNCQLSCVIPACSSA